MLTPMLHLHRFKALAVLAVAVLIPLASYGAGELKPLAAVDWLDVFGEGGMAMLTLCWIGMILNSRPAGRVTNLLVVGLSCLFIATWQDTMDEFIVFAPHVSWDGWVESFPPPVGMLLLTLGIFHWHREQLTISDQLSRRERIFREHTSIDRMMPLAAADYLRRQLEHALSGHAQRPFALLMLDLDDFGAVNRNLGPAEGDRLLREVGELLVLNLRRGDLLCRYAGDRFAVLLPGADRELAVRIAGELSEAVRHFAFKSGEAGETLYQRLSVGYAVAGDGDTHEGLLRRVNQALERAKREQTGLCPAA